MEINEARKGWAAMAKIHRSHPVCPRCRKALYKAPRPGMSTTKRDRFAWCRNPRCALFGRDIGDVVLIGDVLVDLALAGDRATLVAMLEAMS